MSALALQIGATSTRPRLRIQGKGKVMGAAYNAKWFASPATGRVGQ